MIPAEREGGQRPIDLQIVGDEDGIITLQAPPGQIGLRRVRIQTAESFETWMSSLDCAQGFRLLSSDGIVE